MENDSLLVLSGNEVTSLLAGREPEIVSIGRARPTWPTAAGTSSLPHSTFLRFPGNEANRIIALPAFLGDGFDVAG